MLWLAAQAAAAAPPASAAAVQKEAPGVGVNVGGTAAAVTTTVGPAAAVTPAPGPAAADGTAANLPARQATPAGSRAIVEPARGGESSLWFPVVLALLGLAAGAVALYLAWTQGRELAAAQDERRALDGKLAHLSDRLAELASAHLRDAAKFDDDADRVGKDIVQLQARLKILEAGPGPAAPIRPQPMAASAPPAAGAPRADTAARSRVAPAASAEPPRSLGVQLDFPRLNEAPAAVAHHAQQAPTDLHGALQQAAVAALEESVHPDAASFTLAVLQKLPPDLARRLKHQGQRISTHSSTAGMRADFTRPDFISVVGAAGEGLLLPYPKASYAYSHITNYEGERELWPHVKTAARCRIDQTGNFQLIAKGTLG